MRIEKLRTEHNVTIEWVHFPLHPETPAEGRWQADAIASLTWWGADFPAVPTSMHTAAAWMETAAALHDEPVIVDAVGPEPQATAT